MDPEKRTGANCIFGHHQAGPLNSIYSHCKMQVCPIQCTPVTETECNYHRTLVEMVLLLSGPVPDWQMFHTWALVDELAKRDGVEDIRVNPNEGFVAANCGSDHQTMLQERGGPARILVVID